MIKTRIGEPAWMYDTASSEVVMQTYDPLIFMKRTRYDEFVVEKVRINAAV